MVTAAFRMTAGREIFTKAGNHSLLSDNEKPLTENGVLSLTDPANYSYNTISLCSAKE